MPEFLRDPLWQSIGALSGIAALIVAIIAVFVQRRRKQLSYEIISSIPVLGTQEAIAGKLEMFFEQKPVTDVQLLEVRFVNSGNQPITAADYEQPVALTFDDKARVLIFEVTATTPKTLKASLTTDGTRVLMTPLLLNGGDSVNLRLLIAGFKNAPSIDGRIIGVSRIRPVRSEFRWQATSLVGMVLVLTSGLGGIVARRARLPKSPPIPRSGLDNLYLGIGIVGLILIIVSMVNWHPSADRRR
jgi:hypothetical protein